LNDLNSEYEVFICEMGAYHKGGIKLLTDIVKPKVGILTGINGQHLATYGSLENIKKTKYELRESLPQDGLAVFNGNNKYCVELYKKTDISKKLCNIVSTDTGNILQGDLWAENVEVKKDKICFDIISKNGEKGKFQVNLLGLHNVENILLATACAKELGMTLEEISLACNKIKPLDKGLRLRKSNGLNILDATYSANFNGVISHLDYLKNWTGKKIIVMPCLIELGKESKNVHQKIGSRIGEVCDSAVITTKEHFKDIKEKAVEKGINPENILFLEKPEDIFAKVRNFSGKEDIVLLESRVPRKLLNFLKIG